MVHQQKAGFDKMEIDAFLHSSNVRMFSFDLKPDPEVKDWSVTCHMTGWASAVVSSKKHSLDHIGEAGKTVLTLVLNELINYQNTWQHIFFHLTHHCSSNRFIKKNVFADLVSTIDSELSPQWEIRFKTAFSSELNKWRHYVVENHSAASHFTIVMARSFSWTLCIQNLTKINSYML